MKDAGFRTSERSKGSGQAPRVECCSVSTTYHTHRSIDSTRFAPVHCVSRAYYHRFTTYGWDGLLVGCAPSTPSLATTIIFPDCPVYYAEMQGHAYTVHLIWMRLLHE
jgi:hypothetical protein